MGRTVPSFRNVLAEEQREWKVFRNALDKSEKKAFDEMWDIPRLYITACSNSVSLVPFHPICMFILFHHYKELMECSKHMDRMMNKVKMAQDSEKVEEPLPEALLRQHQQQQQLRLSDF